MYRRHFLTYGAAGISGLSVAQAAAQSSGPQARLDDVVIERAVPGRPHAGKVLAAIQPHADDIPIFAAGTVAKLLNEGYTGYLIRVTNDDMAGPGTIAETALANERDNQEVARVLGLKQVFDLNYNNHRMDDVSPVHLPVSPAPGRHDHLLRPLGTLRGEPGPLRHRPRRRVRLLDGRHEQGLPRTLRRRPET